MAGYYPDSPANRFAYQLDGTKAYFRDGSNVLTELSTAQLTLLNDEDTTYAQGDNQYALIFIFPEMRNLQDYFVVNNSYRPPGPGIMEVSADTTNGLDGTWTTTANPWVRLIDTVVPQYRQSINSISPGLIKAVRFNYSPQSPYNDSNSFRTVHLYGTVPNTQNPDRLIFWEPVNDTPMMDAFMDWGDIARGTSKIKQFRIKNNSATKTANNVTISSGTTSDTMALNFSTDGTTYNSTINLASLAPGAISPVLYAQRSVPSNEVMRVQACYLRAAPASWT